LPIASITTTSALVRVAANAAKEAPCPRWAHHKTSLQREQPDDKDTNLIIPDNGIVLPDNGIVLPDNGIVERLHRKLHDEHFRVEGHRTWFETIDEMR
jgi:hypothetical protein